MGSDKHFHYLKREFSFFFEKKRKSLFYKGIGPIRPYFANICVNNGPFGPIIRAKCLICAHNKARLHEESLILTPKIEEFHLRMLIFLVK